MNQVPNELKHWGVLGMHWGKQKAPTRDEKYAKENVKLAKAHEKFKASGKSKPKPFLTSQKESREDKIKYKQEDAKLARQHEQWKAARKAGGQKPKSLQAQGQIRSNEAKVRYHKIKIGASIVAGLMATTFGGVAVYKLSGSESLAKMAAPWIGSLGGMKYYALIKDA